MSFTTPSAGMNGYDPNAAVNASIITSSTPISTGYDPTAGGVQYSSRQTAATRTQLMQEYGRMSPEFRKALAQKLKDAGFNVPVTGSYSAVVREAFLQANEGLSQEITTLSQNDPQRLKQVGYDLDTYLGDLTSQSGGAGGTRTYPTVLSKGDVAELLNSVKQDLTGYGATEDEINYYYDKLRSKALSQPTTQTTTASGQVTQTGFNPRQFLIDKIAKSDSAKERRVLDAYDAFAQAFGIEL
jgi:hypothetical protein